MYGAPKKKDNTNMILIIILIICVCLCCSSFSGVLGYFYMNQEVPVVKTTNAPKCHDVPHTHDESPEPSE